MVEEESGQKWYSEEGEEFWGMAADCLPFLPSLHLRPDVSDVRAAHAATATRGYNHWHFFLIFLIAATKGTSSGPWPSTFGSDVTFTQFFIDFMADPTIFPILVHPILRCQPWQHDEEKKTKASDECFDADEKWSRSQLHAREQCGHPGWQQLPTLLFSFHTIITIPPRWVGFMGCTRFWGALNTSSSAMVSIWLTPPPPPRQHLPHGPLVLTFLTKTFWHGKIVWVQFGCYMALLDIYG